MASREPALFPSQGRCNVANKHTYRVEVTYGASAVTSYRGREITLADTSAGKMTITFPRTYRSIEGFRWGWTSCAAGAVLFPVILTDDVDDTGTVIVETRTEAGTATDPASGDKLILEFDLSYDILNDAPVTTL